MLSDLLWVGIIGCFSFFGLRRPYFALCSIVWVDILKPQNISYGFLSGKPVSLIVVCIFLCSCFLNFNDISFPRKKAPIFLLVLFLCWITITTYFAQFQAAAWFKHDAAYKTILITLFFPFVLNSRIKIEAFLATIVAAVSYYTIIGGVRTVLGQGAYGTYLVSTNAGNSGMSETSTLAMVSVMMLPVIYYLYKNSRLVYRTKYLKPIFAALLFLSVLTCIGTYARTGLVGLAVCLFFVVITSKQKSRIFSFGIVSVILIILFAPQGWKDRMNTIQNPEEDASSLGRLVVWNWTIDFASRHPFLGGGFNAYLANKGELNKYTDGPIEFNRAKAFHNIFFEVLGEHGYVGLFIFILILFNCYNINRHIYKTVNPANWMYSLARLMNLSLVVYLVCGNFIAVAFGVWPYYYLSLAISLDTCKHNEHLEKLS